jgi:glycosyltransferase involved in cell wall biosynthesis
MNILSLFYKKKPGGFTKRLYQLYRVLADAGHHVHFIGSESLSLEHENIRNEVLKAPFQDSENILFWLSFARQTLSRSLEVSDRHSIDRIVTFGPFYTALCLLPIRKRGIPAVTFIRADNQLHSANKARNLLFHLMDNYGLRISSKVVFVSHSLKDVYKKRFRLNDEKICVLPNNIETLFEVAEDAKRELRRSLGLSDRDFVLSTMGVLTKNKNFEYVIQAMRHFNDARIKLMIVGDEINQSGERKRLEDLALKISLKDRIVFCGWQDEPMKYVASSDLFVYPSRFEGSPNALLEALSCGIPCIGSDIDEIREILAHPDLLFSLGDELELSSKIMKTVKDESYYKLLAALSKERCATFMFDWNKKAVETVCN